MTLKQMYQRAIKHWGRKKQIEKAKEELKELRDELLKITKKNYIYKTGIITECADVINMIKQLQLIFKISNKEIYDEMKRKMERTMIRIDEEEQSK